MAKEPSEKTLKRLGQLLGPHWEKLPSDAQSMAPALLQDYLKDPLHDDERVKLVRENRELVPAWIQDLENIKSRFLPSPQEYRRLVFCSLLSLLALFLIWAAHSLAAHDWGLDQTSRILWQCGLSILALVVSCAVIAGLRGWPDTARQDDFELGITKKGHWFLWWRLSVVLLSAFDICVSIETLILLLGGYWKTPANLNHLTQANPSNLTFVTWTAATSTFSIALSLVSFFWLFIQIRNQQKVNRHNKKLLEEIHNASTMAEQAYMTAEKASEAAANVLNAVGFLPDRRMLDHHLHQQYERFASEEGITILMRKEDYRVYPWIEEVFISERDEKYPRKFVFLGDFSVLTGASANLNQLEKAKEAVANLKEAKVIKEDALSQYISDENKDFFDKLTLLLLAVGRAVDERGRYLNTSSVMHVPATEDEPQFAFVQRAQGGGDVLFLLEPIGNDHRSHGFTIHKFFNDKIMEFFRKTRVAESVTNAEAVKNIRSKQEGDISAAKNEKELFDLIMQFQESNTLASTLAYGYLSLLGNGSNAIDLCIAYAKKHEWIDKNVNENAFNNRLVSWWGRRRLEAVEPEPGLESLPAQGQS